MSHHGAATPERHIELWRLLLAERRRETVDADALCCGGYRTGASHPGGHGDVKFGVGIYPIGPAADSIRLARLANEVGFDFLWLADTHMIWREMYVLLGAMAVTTSRIAMGPGITHPFVRHQSVIASAMTTWAELIPGRVHLGMGIGASGPANVGLKQALVFVR